MIYVVIPACIVLGWLALLVFLRRVWFYRDPCRQPEREEAGIIVAPADGRVVYIRKIEEGGIYSEKLGERIPLPEIAGCGRDDMGGEQGWAIGIYMSPLDVHYNYCPYPATVEGIFYKAAKVNYPMLDLWEYIRVVWLRRMSDMFARKYHLENERNTIFLDGGGIRMAVVLIADKFVAKIRCFVEEGQPLAYSQKLGFISRGSQVDLFVFASNIKFEVGVNQQVYGGKTVIARIDPSSPAVAAAGPAAGHGPERK